MAVLLERAEGTLRRVDRKISEVRPTQPFDLGVQIGKVAALEKRVVAEVDTRHNIGSAQRNLLGLGDEIIDATI
jgi:hypothetical protein